MKRLFQAVRNNDLETVKRILEVNPELINCVATPPPKKDEGQSLQRVTPVFPSSNVLWSRQFSF